MQPICQQRPVNLTVRCKKYPENAVKSIAYLLFLQYIVLCMFLQCIGLKNGKILQCTVKVFWSSENRSFVFNQIFVYGTLMGVDYKSEKKI